MGTCCSTGNASLKKQNISLAAVSQKPEVPELSAPSHEVDGAVAPNACVSGGAEDGVLPVERNDSFPQGSRNNKNANNDEDLSESRNTLTETSLHEEMLMETAGSTRGAAETGAVALPTANDSVDEQGNPRFVDPQGPLDENRADAPSGAKSPQAESKQFARISSIASQPFPPSEAFMSCRSLNVLPSGRAGNFRRLGSACSNSRSSLCGAADSAAALPVLDTGRFASCRSTAATALNSLEDPASCRARGSVDLRPPLVPGAVPPLPFARVPSKTGAPGLAPHSQRANSVAAESARFHTARSAASEQVTPLESLPGDENAQNLPSPTTSLRSNQPRGQSVASSRSLAPSDGVPLSLRVAQGGRKKQLSAKAFDASTSVTRATSLCNSTVGSVHEGKVTRRRPHVASVVPGRSVTTPTSQIQETDVVDLASLGENSHRLGTEILQVGSGHHAVSTLHTISPTTVDTERQRPKNEELTPSDSGRMTDSFQFRSNGNVMDTEVEDSSQFPEETVNPTSPSTPVENNAETENAEAENVDPVAEGEHESEKAPESPSEPQPDPVPAEAPIAEKSGLREATPFENREEVREDCKENGELNDHKDVDNNDVDEDGQSEQGNDEAEEDDSSSSTFEEEPSEVKNDVKETLKGDKGESAPNALKDHNGCNGSVTANGDSLDN